MAHENDGLSDLFLEGEKFVLKLGADEGIERGERLIHQQDIGIGRKGAGEADALLHAA